MQPAHPDGNPSGLASRLEFQPHREPFLGTADHTPGMARWPIERMAEFLPGAMFRFRVLADGTRRLDFMTRGCYDLWELDADAVEQIFQLVASQTWCSTACGCWTKALPDWPCASQKGRSNRATALA